MTDKITFELSDEDKDHYKKKIENITEEDEIEVKTNFGKKLADLEKWVKKAPYVPNFVATLICDVKFLYELLCHENYSVSWQTKAWIIFALGYFIAPIDAIPDVFPVIGFMDDAVIVAWVCHNLKKEIEAYKKFLDEGEAQPA